MRRIIPVSHCRLSTCSMDATIGLHNMIMHYAKMKNVKYLKKIRLIIALLVTCQGIYNDAHVGAFHPANDKLRLGSTIIRPTCYGLRCIRDSTKIRNSKNADGLDLSGCDRDMSKATHPLVNHRRDLLQQVPLQASLLLATLMVRESTAYAQPYSTVEPLKAKTIVITGANSGIGFEACKRLTTKGHTIILACRSFDKAQDAIRRIQLDNDIPMNGKLIPAECDLADMSSIRKFVAEVSANTKIDTLCLNAGVARNTAATDCARTKDGFELTGKFYHTLHSVELMSSI